MDAALMVVLQNVALDPFDLLHLRRTSKTQKRLVDTYSPVEAGEVDVKMYICLYGFLVHEFPNQFNDETQLAGVKISFIMKKLIKDSGNRPCWLWDQVYFGFAQKTGMDAQFYFGGSTELPIHCLSVKQAHKKRDLVKQAITSFINNIYEINIFYYNIKEDIFAKFLAIFMSLITKICPSERRITIQYENIPENVLICHDR